jgi:ATP-dependent helicase HrpB
LQKVLLPIDPHLDAIAALVEKHPCLVLQASPGSGKTTRVPPFLADRLLNKANQEVWVLEPRRLAARLAATRVAFERGQKPGEDVGYQFRWERVVGPRTKVRFLTEGTLVRLLLQDPLLPNVGIVILDEFHERHLQGDEALALLLQLQRTSRPDLKIVLMSATMESDYFSNWLQCPVHTVEGRLFPIQTEYFLPAANQPLEQSIARVIRDQWRQHGSDCGDFLVFLPGMAEILRTESALLPMLGSSNAFVAVLHGDSDADTQKRAIEPGNGKKIILSTNIAESSVTIEGIRVVIDSGLQRVFHEDASTGVALLRTQKTSKSSCIQRANRAGRLGPGTCIRLFSQSDYYGRPDSDIPEILRTDLSHTLLEIRALGFMERKLQWPSPIPEERWQKSEALLERLGAIADSKLTHVGKRLSELPLSPRIGRFLLEAGANGAIESGIELAVLLTEGKMPGIDLLELAEQKRAPARMRDRLQKFFPSSKNTESPDALARALLVAFPDRVAERRKPFGKTEETFVLAESGSAAMPCHSSLGDKRFFVIPALQKSENRTSQTTAAKVLGICPIEEEWLLDLPGQALQSSDAFSWDEKTKRLTRRQELRYGAIVLESQDSPPQKDLSAAEAFARQALGVTDAILLSGTARQWLECIRTRTDSSEAENAAARLHFFLSHHPDRNADGFWTSRFMDALTGVFTQEDLKNVDWCERLVPAAWQDALHRFAPTGLQLGKRRAKIQYSFEKEPWVESRLQDFFGLKSSPAVGGGKVPLTLHLLAPNQRAVQVTRDLVSFWKNTYPTLRNQLARRYPRHAWPEDPTQP